MAGDDSTETRRAAGRGWLRWVLAGSLALNLLVAGLVAGAFLRGDAPGRSMRLDLSIFPYTQAFAPEDRAALLRDWRARGPAPREIAAQRQAEQRAVLAALRADPFVPATLEAAMAMRLDQAQAHQALGQAILVERLRALDPAARALYADRLEDAIARGPRPRRSDDAPDRPRPAARP